MAKITVHILMFHEAGSAIKIVLTKSSTEDHEFYTIYPIPIEFIREQWHSSKNADSAKRYLREADSRYSFDIEADPDHIISRWKAYRSTKGNEPCLLSTNCAVMAQWFLTTFAGIPKPNLSNVSINHFFLGILWPSFIPCPVTLPGRIMSNAKFYIEARKNPELANQYSDLFLYISMSLAALLFEASIFALTVAAIVLSGGIAGLAIAGCVAVSMASTYGFFKGYNVLSAKNISYEPNRIDALPALI